MRLSSSMISSQDLQRGAQRTFITCALYHQAPTTTTQCGACAWHRPLRIKRKRNNSKHWQQQQHLKQQYGLWCNRKASVEMPLDVSHAGQLGLRKQSLCRSGSEFTSGGQYTHFITFCQKAQWNVCGTLFLCMSPPTEFLITNVATRPLLMSFVQDNYGLAGTARQRMKRRLCVVWVDVALWPLLLSIPWVWPGLFVSRRIRASESVGGAALEAERFAPAPLPPFHIGSPRSATVPNWSSCSQWGRCCLPFPRDQFNPVCAQWWRLSRSKTLFSPLPYILI